MTISVLVADDSPTIRRRAQATLGEAGFDVHCVEDGQAAWEELDSGSKPDVLLCDILMPKLDGYELCGRVKGDSRFAGVPVLLLRGTFEPWDETRAMDAGADGFITKPFEPENLVGTVRDVLEAAGEDEDTGATEEAAEVEPDFDGDTILSPSSDEGFSPGEPEPVAAAEEDSPFGASDEPAADPFGGDDDPLALGDEEAATPAPEPVAAAPAPAPAPVSAAAAPSGGGGSIDTSNLDDAALDALATRVAAKLTGDVIEKLAWDLVPEVAEALIRKRMIEIENKLQGG